MNEVTQKTLISPSILSADFSKLGEEVRNVESAGCDMVHVDVMDGHFVPNLTIGAPVVKWLRKVTELPLDVHLMIDDPIRYVEDFLKAGSNLITFHIEATDKVNETIAAIRKGGAKVGISLRPKTEISVLDPYLDKIDLVLIMTVEPGFGGQSFMPNMLDKVRELKKKFKGLVSVDGGINRDTATSAIESGADILVAGTAIFGNQDRCEAIKGLRNNS